MKWPKPDLNKRKFIKTAGIVGVGLLLTHCKTIDNYIITKVENHFKNKSKEEIDFIESLSDYVYLSESKIIGKMGETEVPIERQGYGVVVHQHYISMGHIYAPTMQTPFGEMDLELKERTTYLHDFRYLFWLSRAEDCNLLGKGKELEEIIVKHGKEDGEYEDVAVFKIPKELNVKEFPCPPSTEYKLGDRIAMIGNPWLDGWNYRTGKITDIDGHSKFKNDFSVSTMIAGGDSGTPCINLENRTLIGLATYRRNTLAYVKGMKSFEPYIK